MRSPEAVFSVFRSSTAIYCHRLGRSSQCVAGQDVSHCATYKTRPVSQGTTGMGVLEIAMYKGDGSVEALESSGGGMLNLDRCVIAQQVPDRDLEETFVLTLLGSTPKGYDNLHPRALKNHTSCPPRAATVASKLD